MPESLNHTALLDRLFKYVTYAYDSDGRYLVLHDLPSAIGSEKPPMIGGFRPDLYASHGPLHHVIIGEAKTARDLDTAHSREQYRAYARHLACCAHPTLILAVPWPLRVRAKTLIRLAVEEAGAPAIGQVVIDEAWELGS